MNPKSIHLNPSEWHVMEFLWAHGPATGRQAADHLTEKLGWSRSTTLTLLRRLEGKGAVARKPASKPSDPWWAGRRPSSRRRRISWTVSTRAASASWSVP